MYYPILSSLQSWIKISLLSFNRKEKCVLEGLSDLPTGKQMENDRARFWVHALSTSTWPAFQDLRFYLD
jgi:hypothetical protein